MPADFANTGQIHHAHHLFDKCTAGFNCRNSQYSPSIPNQYSHSESGTARRRTTNTWFDELGDLSLPLFKRLISATKTRDHTSPDLIEGCLIAYAKRYISTSLPPSQDEQRELLQTIISNLPREKRLTSSTSAIKFLFGLLRTTNILNIAKIYRDALEKKIGSQLERYSRNSLTSGKRWVIVLDLLLTVTTAVNGLCGASRIKKKIIFPEMAQMVT
ncbi:hypothetical protein POM88_050447 [Heracleum sosnowskyi]|uniref:NPH3 domain-containing protein n=1 Tax=Heracleum sosnowskyi TaxID=360622 RepID=A0AAD8H0B5_9APIA|nr:hypothetical protein POM88_050447 [Heracleum sosnowskyi]